jgi:hypothetical protein
MHKAALVIIIPGDELRMYRSHTLGILRRYFRMSLELGRLPSLVGREIFRARVSSYRSASFEDLVIFVTDVERCVEQLDQKSQLAIARVIFQEFSVEEAGHMLGWNERTVRRVLAGGLDLLAQTMLDRGLLQPYPVHDKSCQEAKKTVSGATH